MLQHYSSLHNYTLIQIPAETLNEVNISSTKIRNALLHGEISNANKLLGYNYYFSGSVVKGKQIGRTIGFKTANIQVPYSEKLIPGNGVYVVTVKLHNNLLQGMMNIGTRPTVDGQNRVIEVHILNFDTDIYDETLEVTIHTRLRNEQKFSDLTTLKLQLHADKQATEEYFT